MFIETSAKAGYNIKVCALYTYIVQVFVMCFALCYVPCMSLLLLLLLLVRCCTDDNCSYCCRHMRYIHVCTLGVAYVYLHAHEADTSLQIAVMLVLFSVFIALHNSTAIVP
jgi:hypothetical protein